MILQQEFVLLGKCANKMTFLLLESETKGQKVWSFWETFRVVGVTGPGQWTFSRSFSNQPSNSAIQEASCTVRKGQLNQRSTPKHPTLRIHVWCLQHFLEFTSEV